MVYYFAVSQWRSNLAKRLNQDLPEGVDGNRSERFLADLRGMIWHKVDNEGGFKTLAAKANLNVATIDRLMWSGDANHPQTRRPHFETVVRLLWALERLDLLDGVFAGEHKRIPWGRKKRKK
jgi:hypothetical protein